MLCLLFVVICFVFSGLPPVLDWIAQYDTKQVQYTTYNKFSMSGISGNAFEIFKEASDNLETPDRNGCVGGRTVQQFVGYLNAGKY